MYINDLEMEITSKIGNAIRDSELNEDKPNIEQLTEFVSEMKRLERLKKELQELGDNINQVQSARTTEIARKYMPIIDKEIDEFLKYYDFEE
jgi:hypothetical protein